EHPASDDRAGVRLGELEAEIEALQGYSADAEAATLLSGLGLDEAQHVRRMSELSGGFRLRVLLAQVLFSKPDLLLLDEPTNHLDLASIRWLEGYLRALPGAFVVISHDRHFLNAVCTSIADLDYQELHLYTGDYDAFEAAKALATTQREADIARAEAKIEDLQEFVDRFRAKATKARQASARKKQVEKIEIPEVKRSSRRAPAFAFGIVRPSGREVLRVEGVSKRYGDRQVLHDVTFNVERGERVAVVGPNGIGKSTLLKIIVGAIEADAGTTALGHEVHLGYFAQDHAEVLHGDRSAFQWLGAAGGTSELAAIRGMLGRVLLGGDASEKRVSDLSGGEATRLILGALMLRRPNLLVLDEPTNHLDLESREALMNALRAYPGTLLFVSHDRNFVSAVGTRVLGLTVGGIEDFPGTYEEYIAKEGEDYLALGAATSARSSNGTAPPRTLIDALPVPPMTPATPRSSAEDYASRKDRRATEARLRREIARLEASVADLEAALASTERELADPTYYQRVDRAQLERDVQRQRDLQAQLAAALATWEATTLEFEALTLA
ncbi:MAG: ATP-binding cassette domain-containing protein, partial [Dehalococcoidia bacterium]|nr:ATP-binding cassette domain-containing protein [Dehalococcoidia bacterium]